MARMYPERSTVDVSSNAERDLYYLFREQLPDDYVVFHSVRWQHRKREGGVFHGEADFIIAHPEDGILVVEVKGGQISFDGRSGQWYQNGKQMERDPEEQARGNMYDLRTMLRNRADLRDRMPSLGFALAFPDCEVPHDLRPDIPKAIVLDWRDRRRIQAWVEQVMARHIQPHRTYPMGEAGIERLIDLLSPTRTIVHPMAADFQSEGEQILRLTEDQFRLLDMLSGQMRAAVSGCAGSGKTTLALYKARNLGEQGFRVLLTCFNAHLAKYLGSAENMPTSVETLTFQGVRQKVIRAAGLDADKPRGEWLKDQAVDQAWTDLMLKALDKLGPQYDAIVVDEGRDFRPGWWDALQCLLPDLDHGILYVFYDDNQNLYDRPLSLPKGLNPVHLTENLRNTQLIHQTFVPFYRAGQAPVSRGPLGRPTEVTYYQTDAELKRLLQAKLNVLINNERVPREDVVVLSPRSNTSVLWRLGPYGMFNLTNNWNNTRDIYCTSIYGYKGLESPVVILAELTPSDHQDLAALLYVGCSRAKNHLIILARSDLQDDIRQRLPASAVK